MYGNIFLEFSIIIFFISSKLKFLAFIIHDTNSVEAVPSETFRYFNKYETKPCCFIINYSTH